MSLIHLASSPLSSIVRQQGPEHRRQVQRDWRLFPSESFTPMHFKVLKIPDENPLALAWVHDTGNTTHKSAASLRSEVQKLITYFIESLHTPDDEKWVNFSAYEPDRIMAPALLPTSMGQDLLAQDILLKRLATSLVHPDTESGKEYWARVFDQVHRTFGTTPHHIDAFPKVWMVPDKAAFYEFAGPLDSDGAGGYQMLQWEKPGKIVCLVDSHLGVRLEQDRVATAANHTRYAPSYGAMHSTAMETTAKRMHDICLPIYEDLILKLIEREVNEGAHFGPMRQLYNAMCFSTWFKKTYHTDPRVARYLDTNEIRLTPIVGNSENIGGAKRIQQEGELLGVDAAAFFVYAKRLGFTLALDLFHSAQEAGLPQLQLERAAVTAHVVPTHDGLTVTVTGEQSSHSAVETAYHDLMGYAPVPGDLPPEDLVQVLVEYGVLLNDAGYHALALHCADRALALAPSHGRAWHMKGAALAGLDQHHEAVRCYQQALTHDPDLLRAWTNLGNRYLALHELDKAHGAFETAIAAPGRRGEEEPFRIIAYEQLGRLEEALAWGNKLLCEPMTGMDREGIRRKLRDIERQQFMVRSVGSGRHEAQAEPGQSAPATRSVQNTPSYAQYMELFRAGVYTMVHRELGAPSKHPRLRLLVSGGIQLNGIPLEYRR